VRLRDNVIEDVGVEEDQGAEGLVLGCGGEAAANNKVVEEGFDVGGAELGGVPPRAVRGSTKGEELSDPARVSVECIRGEAASAADDDELFEQFHGNSNKYRTN
jgi:hypothetical protein